MKFHSIYLTYNLKCINIYLKGGSDMIRIKLSRIMGDRRKNIQKVSDETGLSRSTISMLYNEKANRIDFKTLDKLCDCLDCDICDIIK